MPPITRTPRYDTVDAGPHAVTVADGFDYTYDDVGNLTVADDSTSTYTYTYDVRNQLIAVDRPGTDDLTMVYDTDGNRVTRTEGATTVTYIGGLYEITDNGSTVTTRTHYMFAGDMVGIRVDDGTTDTITYTFGDHLGSVTAAYTPPQNGNPDGLQTQYYKPYGEPRGTAATLPSDRTYTGQINDPGVLMYYNARYYQPSVGRFTQPDTIIPDPGNGQDYNRYMYVRGNPVGYSDPTGNRTEFTKDGAHDYRKWHQPLPEKSGSARAWASFWTGVVNLVPHAAEQVINAPGDLARWTSPVCWAGGCDWIPHVDVPDLAVEEGYQWFAFAGEAVSGLILGRLMAGSLTGARAGAGATNGLGEAGALRTAAVEVHDLATPAIRHNMSTVAVMEAEIPGAGTQFFVAGSSGRLSAAQIARLQELGVPAENILRGHLHAELNILNGLPEGATPIRWGIAWAGGNKPIPCTGCAPFVQGIIEGAP